MTYLYGDSTPFPLDTNFLEVLSDLTSACVSLLQAEHWMRQAHEVATTRAGQESSDQAWADEVQDALTRVLAGVRRSPATPGAQEEVENITRGLHLSMERLRDRIRADSASYLRDAEAVVVQQRQEGVDAVKAYLAQHKFPLTAWETCWSVVADEELTPRAEARGMNPCGLSAHFVLSVPEDSKLMAKARISNLFGALVASFPQRSKRIKRVDLGKYQLLSASAGADEISLQLAKRPRAPKEIIEILLDRPAQDIYLRRLPGGLSQTSEVSETYAVDPSEKDQLLAFLRFIGFELEKLLENRVSVSEVRLGEKPLEENLFRTAETLIELAAPFAAELQRRSSTPDELCLKREISKCRREELFLPISELLKQIEQLPDDFRSCFDPFKLKTHGWGKRRTLKRVPSPKRPLSDEQDTVVTRTAVSPSGQQNKGTQKKEDSLSAAKTLEAQANYG